MNAVIKASGNEVEPYWPGLFAKALKDVDVGALLSNIGFAGPNAESTTEPVATDVVELIEAKKVDYEPAALDDLFDDEY